LIRWREKRFAFFLIHFTRFHHLVIDHQNAMADRQRGSCDFLDVF
jgi:hypothetical protein